MGRVIALTPRPIDPSEQLRVARERCGMQHAEFARVLGRAVGRPQLGSGAVQAWERSEIKPPTEIVAAARELAARAARTPSRPTPVPAPSDQLDATSHTTTQELAERVAAARRVDPAIVELLRAHTNSLRLIDRQLGSSAIFDQLKRHIAHIQSLRHHGCAAQTIQPLAASLAEACTLAGWQALDLGKPHAAWSYYELAKHAAHEASDPNALAHATAEQAYVLIDSGQHDAAIELLGSATAQIRRLPPRLAAWLLSAQAEALAIADQPTLAQRSLELAAARCPPSPPEPDLPYLVLDEVHLERWRGSTLAHLGHPAAVRQLSGALTRIDHSFTRAAAGLHSDLALALARAGEHDQAHHHIHRARKLAETVGSTRQRRRTHQRAASLLGPTIPAG